jgi:hypothetical protein
MKNIPSASSHDYIIPHEHIILIEQIEEPHAHNPEEDDNVVTRKSKRQRIAKSFGDDFIMYLMDDTPRTIEEAFSSPDADLWKESIMSEMDSIMSNQLGKSLNILMGANQKDVNGCSRKSLGLMVLLRGTRQGL